MTAQWQPIETAPKDGTDVLLYLPKADPPVRVGRYVAKGVIRSDYWFIILARSSRHGSGRSCHRTGCHFRSRRNDRPSWRGYMSIERKQFLVWLTIMAVFVSH